MSCMIYCVLINVCVCIRPVKMAATLARQSVTTQRASAGGRHLLGLQPSEEAASFSPGVGFTLYFCAYSASTNIRSAKTAAR